MGWDFETFERQPSKFIETVLIKMKAEAEYNQKNHGN